MSLTTINLIIILLGTAHISVILPYLITKLFSSIISLIALFSSLKFIFNPPKLPNFAAKNLKFAIILISLITLLFGLISTIKGFTFILYFFKMVQVLLFIIPSFYVGYNFFKSKKINLLIDILFYISLLQIIYLFIGGSTFVGCLICRQNYVYGMRDAEGMNLIGNSILTFQIINFALIAAYKKIKSKFENTSIELRMIINKLKIYLTIIFLISMFVPSRQLLLSSLISLILFFGKEFFESIKKYLIRLTKLKIKFNLYFLIFGIVNIGFISFISSVIIGTLSNRFLINFTLDYIRLIQIKKGISIFLNFPFSGIPSNSQINEYYIPKNVFENAYVDIIAKFGIFPLIAIITTISLFVLFSIKNNLFINLKLIPALLFIALFNEVILEPVFWIPIFFSFGLENYIKNLKFSNLNINSN